MQRNLIIGVTAALAGALGGVWLMWPDPLPPPPPPVVRTPRATPQAPPPTTDAVADARSTPRPTSKAPREARRASPDGRAPSATPRPGPVWDPAPPDDLAEDTGAPLPSPAVNIGLPSDDVDDATMINELSREPVNLPERPLSDVEMEVLVERKKWLEDSCAEDPNSNCRLAMLHMDDAIAGAHHMRKEAVIKEFGEAPPPLAPRPTLDPLGTIPDE